MRIGILIACAILIVSGVLVAADQAPKESITGPFTHENLTVFLIHGHDQSGGKKYITLQEALDQKKVVVKFIKNL